MELLILYTDSHQDDAIHAKEVLLDEFHYWKIPAEKLKRDGITTPFGTITFKNVSNLTLEKMKSSPDKVYATQNLKSEYGSTILSLFGPCDWITRPTQALIDYVISIKKRSEQPNKEEKEYEDPVYSSVR